MTASVLISLTSSAGRPGRPEYRIGFDAANDDHENDVYNHLETTRGHRLLPPYLVPLETAGELRQDARMDGAGDGLPRDREEAAPGALWEAGEDTMAMTMRRHRRARHTTPPATSFRSDARTSLGSTDAACTVSQ